MVLAAVVAGVRDGGVTGVLECVDAGTVGRLLPVGRCAAVIEDAVTVHGDGEVAVVVPRVDGVVAPVEVAGADPAAPGAPGTTDVPVPSRGRPLGRTGASDREDA